MNTAAITTPTRPVDSARMWHDSAPAPLPFVPGGAGSFADVLGRAMSGPTSTDARRELRLAANQLVSSAFISPILASLRENSQAQGPFAPNAAEKRFGPLMDQHIADRITEAANFSLIDAIVNRYLPDEPEAAGARNDRID